MSNIDKEQHRGEEGKSAHNRLDYHLKDLFSLTKFADLRGRAVAQRVNEEVFGKPILYIHGVARIHGEFGILPENRLYVLVVIHNEREAYPAFVVPHLTEIRLIGGEEFYQPSPQETLEFGGMLLEQTASIPSNLRGKKEEPIDVGKLRISTQFTPRIGNYLKVPHLRLFPDTPRGN